MDLAADRDSRIRPGAPVGHDDEVGGVGGELFGAPEVGPRPEVVPAPVEEVDDGADLGRDAGQEDTDADGAAEGGGVEEELPSASASLRLSRICHLRASLPRGSGPRNALFWSRAGKRPRYERAAVRDRTARAPTAKRIDRRIGRA